MAKIQNSLNFNSAYPHFHAIFYLFNFFFGPKTTTDSKLFSFISILKSFFFLHQIIPGKHEFYSFCVSASNYKFQFQPALKLQSL